VIWGGVLGLVAYALYRNVALGGVMALAMLLNLVVAALAGIFIPLAMERFGRDPAVGSSVFLTFVTDSMGFFIFLGSRPSSCSRDEAPVLRALAGCAAAPRCAAGGSSPRRGGAQRAREDPPHARIPR
jgi:hypothetical protein